MPVLRLLPSTREEQVERVYADVELRDPSVALVMVTTPDGAAALQGTSGALGDDADRAAFLALRAAADVVLVGAGTVRAEDYGPPRPRGVEHRRARGQPDVPRIAVVTRSGDLDPGARLFSDPARRPLVLTCAAADATHVGALRDVADVVVVGDDRVDVVAAVAELGARGLTRVVAEGGPGLAAQLVDAGLVDELFATLAPTLVGSGPPRLLEGALSSPVDLDLTELRVHDSLLLLRYAVQPGR